AFRSARISISSTRATNSDVLAFSLSTRPPMIPPAGGLRQFRAPPPTCPDKDLRPLNRGFRNLATQLHLLDEASVWVAHRESERAVDLARCAGLELEDHRQLSVTRPRRFVDAGLQRQPVRPIEAWLERLGALRLQRAERERILLVDVESPT